MSRLDKLPAKRYAPDDVWYAVVPMNYWEASNKSQPKVHGLGGAGIRTACGIVTDWGWEAIDADIDCKNCIRVMEDAENE